MAVEQVRNDPRRVTGKRVDAVREWLGRFTLDGNRNGSRNGNANTSRNGSRSGRRRFVSRNGRRASRP